MITINVFLSGAEGQQALGAKPNATVAFSSEAASTFSPLPITIPTTGQDVNVGPPAVALMNEADYGDREAHSAHAAFSSSAAAISGGSAPDSLASEGGLVFATPTGLDATGEEVINTGPPATQPPAPTHNPMED
jgi:hypothetical protein